MTNINDVHSAVCVKRAWIRDRSAAPGRPAPGKIDCPCGNAPVSWYKPGPDITCACGVVYTWSGWIVSECKNPDLRRKLEIVQYDAGYRSDMTRQE